jgi:polysaccharide export outer membrane protein
MTVLAVILSLLLGQAPHRSPAEYVVGAQDRLSIRVFGEADLTRVVTVDGDGTFDFPLIGRVKAVGLTARAIEQDVTTRLKSGFLVNPQVTIEVESYRSQVVYVTGQVRTPGAVPLTGVMSVMEALARAGSPLPDAGPYILINRRQASAAPDAALPAPEKVQMEELQNGRAQQIALRDGDTIFVPKAETFFVTGYVKNPGPFVFDGDVTVTEAISRAGGVTERGSRSRLRITRIVDGKQVVLKNVKLEDTVQPGDSVEVLPRFF